MGRAGKAVTFVFLLVASRVVAAPPTIDLQLVANNLDKVTAITHAGDGSGRLFITLQGGRVMIYNGTNLLATPFLDIRPMVQTNANERGLLSTAFSPGFATNGFFYVYYTAIDTSNMVARFTALPLGTNSVSTSTMQTVIRLPHPGQSNHNGGQLQFGPDGYLYLGPGDGGGGCDLPNNAQNLGSPLGKLLRIDVSDPATNYTIPPSNPFVATNGARPEIWAFGLRNPWRFSFDRLTGDLFIGDVGQDSWEEVDFQPAGSSGGQNYGWRLVEGFHCNTCTNACTNNVTVVQPIFEYANGNPNPCAITGGYRYRGAKIPPLYGTYLYADECSGQIFGSTQSLAGVWSSVQLTGTVFTITTFGEDESGELYASHWASSVGAVYKIVWKDTDGDGLPDDWEQQYFGSATGAVASVDSDGDGFTNLQEFLAGTDPTNAMSALRIISSACDGLDFMVAYNAVMSKKYEFQFIDSLSTSNWVGIATNTVLSTGVSQFTNTAATVSTNRFYRVRLLP